MKKRAIIALFLTANLILAGNLFAQDKKYTVAAVGFYNLENLFDTIHDANKIDFEYLPDGLKKWNREKYNDKLFNMAHVISQIGRNENNKGLDILGVAEIENRGVLEDLVKQTPIKNRNYQIAHFESPDKRGIDVGLLYNPKTFKLLNTKKYRYQPILTKDDTLFTRDQLLVSGLLYGEKIHVIVCHWPSRRGGEKRSRPLRNGAAKVTRHIADSILNADNGAKIFIMGDLNDDPTNQSVKEVIGTKAKKRNMSPEFFYNPWENRYKRGIGTLAYRDSWNLFDQILLSYPLVKAASGFVLAKSEIYKQKFMLTQEGRYKGYPKRTFSNGKYVSGFSDHFPVCVYLIKKEK